MCLQLGIDGVPFMKKGKLAMWPIVAVNATLPPNIRFKRRNMFLFGLWVGGKPKMTTFLKPFVSDFEKHYKEGIIFLNCVFSNI
jgi:hypothetical protein